MGHAGNGPDSLALTDPRPAVKRCWPGLFVKGLCLWNLEQAVYNQDIVDDTRS